MVPSEIVEVKRWLVALLQLAPRHLENRPWRRARTTRIHNNQCPAPTRCKHGRHPISSCNQQTDVWRARSNTTRFQQAQDFKARTVIQAIWISTSYDHDHGKPAKLFVTICNLAPGDDASSWHDAPVTMLRIDPVSMALPAGAASTPKCAKGGRTIAAQPAHRAQAAHNSGGGPCNTCRFHTVARGPRVRLVRA